MINKMHRTRELTTDSLNVKFGLKECIDEGMFINATITSSILRENGSYIGVEVLVREDGKEYYEVVTKQIAFSVVNGVIYYAIPLVGLCNM